MVFLLLLLLVLLRVYMYVCSTMTTRQSSTIQHPTVSVNRLCKWKLQSSMLLLLLSSIDFLLNSDDSKKKSMMELQHASRATNPCCTIACCYNGDGSDDDDDYDDLTKCKMLQSISKDQHHSSTLLRQCCYYPVHGSFPGAQYLFGLCLASVEKFSFKRHYLYLGCCIQQFLKLGLIADMQTVLFSPLHFLKNVHGNNTNPQIQHLSLSLSLSLSHTHTHTSEHSTNPERFLSTLYVSDNS